MSRRRTGYSEQPAEYYDRDWIRRLTGKGTISVDESIQRRTYTSSHATKYVVGDSVLDLCCGIGQLANMIDDRKYLGIDFSAPQLAYAVDICKNPNARFIRADVRNITSIGRFDTVVMGEALEHFDNPEAVVEIAHQHAKKRIVITLPTKNGPCHVWENFEEKDIRELLRDGESGEVIVCDPFKCLMGTNRWVAVKELYPRVLVTGAGGFIGSHLVNFLKEKRYWVRGVDLHHSEYSPDTADEFLLLDLRSKEAASEAVQGIDWVFALAADFGGMRYIDDPSKQAAVIYNNGMINHNTLEAAREAGVERYLFTSSVCVYPTNKLDVLYPEPLKEEDVYPALPQRTYGWEKLHTEHLVAAYGQVYNMETRIARLQNTYGPWGSWQEDPRTKAPGDLCRKVAMAKTVGSRDVEIWGDGESTRSFMYIDDCVQGLYQLMQSDYPTPVTLGPDRVVSINELVSIIAKAAGIDVVRVYVDGPQGVRGRNFDHTRAKEILGWTAQISLEEGIKKTYDWIEEQLSKT